MPDRVARLPRNHVGYPVPWFVAWIDGVPDFRVANAAKVRQATRSRLCWICGRPLGPWTAAFLIGPMCGVSHTSAEPPSHEECAVYAAQACPWLATPTMRRREGGRPAGFYDPAGVMITRNPGVALVWVSARYFTVPAPGGVGFLFNIGEPLKVMWYAHGRAATRAEVVASLNSGMPTLREAANVGGPAAHVELDERMEALLALVPAGP